MARVAILGAAAVGSAAALQLARSGWQVTLVDAEVQDEFDPLTPERPRPGRPQAVHAHGFGSRTHVELAARLPDVWDALLEAGAPTVTLSEMVPPSLYDGGRPGDSDLTVLQARRHLVDGVLYDRVRSEPAITRVAQRATGLLLDTDASIPTVCGLSLADGTRVEADVTIDAGGRRSPVTGWLRLAGIEQPQRHDESVARYYSRHYRVGPKPPSLNSGFADIHAFLCHVQLLFVGDNGTAVLGLAAHDADPVLKLLRKPEAFEAVLAANEAFAEWRAVLEPTSDIYCLGAFDNRMRWLVSDDRPLALGLFQVGDSLAMTNPTRGRGISMGLLTVGRLVDLLGEKQDAEGTIMAFAQWQAETLGRYYRECAETDAVTADQMRAGLAGMALPNNAPALELPAGHPISCADLEQAADHDPDLFRVLLRGSVMLDDDGYTASDEVAAWVRRVLAHAPPAPTRPVPASGGLHDRAIVEELLAPFA